MSMHLVCVGAVLWVCVCVGGDVDAFGEKANQNIRIQ